MPAKVPISSQKSRPIAKNAADSTTATNTISTSSPRTNAPSFWSISTQVSRVTRRCRSGTTDCTSAIVLSRSKIQYAATANMKKIPTRISNAVFVIVSAGWRSFVPVGSRRRRLSRLVRIVCLIPLEWVAS